MVPGRQGRAERRGAWVAAALAAAFLAGCDDQLKYVPWFSSMSQQPAVETYEEAPRAAPEGAVSLRDRPRYPLAEAESLANPLRATSDNVSRGRVRFEQFCTPCHGPTGRGDGAVIMSEERPRGIPFTPALDLHSEAAKARSDGYLWGMITEGRGLMPSYRRIPEEDRWRIVLYVRHLQGTGGSPGADTGTSAAAEAGSAAEASGEAAGGAR